MKQLVRRSARPVRTAIHVHEIAYGPVRGLQRLEIHAEFGTDMASSGTGESRATSYLAGSWEGRIAVSSIAETRMKMTWLALCLACATAACGQSVAGGSTGLSAKPRTAAKPEDDSSPARIGEVDSVGAEPAEQLDILVCVWGTAVVGSGLGGQSNAAGRYGA